MVIAIRQPDEILMGTRRYLGLPLSSSAGRVADDTFLAAMIRHCAGFLCPCSAATLRTSAMESLEHLVEHEGLAERIEDAIDGLTMGGDLLELSQATTDDEAVRGTWLFAAPPGFVIRKEGNIFLTGVVTDQDTYLPLALAEQIQYDGYSRVLKPRPDENLAEELDELGLQPISQEAWLKCPRAQAAADMVSGLEARVRTGSRSGDIPNLQLLDPERPVTYYRGRWVDLKKQSGVFVARRPQEYGSPIWCLVEVQDGEAKKLLDFPLPKNRWRGCDSAWHLQMAIDHLRDVPQRYRIRPGAESTHLDFFSPIPLWAQRRLMVIGRNVPAEKCLISFLIPEDELEEEERFLQERLWLARTDEKQGL